jgi:hypothetical protein
MKNPVTAHSFRHVIDGIGSSYPGSATYPSANAQTANCTVLPAFALARRSSEIGTVRSG